MKKVIFGIVGAVLGLPLSYYFQSDIIKAKVGGVGGYMKNFNKLSEVDGVVSNVFISVFIFAVLGVIIGYFIDKNASN